MKFVIDTKEIDALGVPTDVLVFLLASFLRAPITPETPKKANRLGYTIETSVFPFYEMERAGGELIEQAFLNTEIGGNIIERGRYEELADKLRELYPKGRKEGTNYMWRDSTAIIAKRLKALVKKYGDCFTDEQAIEATKKYIESFNGNYNYMQLLKYFISKKKVIDGEIEESSQLLSFIQNEGQDNVNNEWTAELR